MEKSWYRKYSGGLAWQAILMVGGAVLFAGLIGLRIYGSYGNFEISSADGVNTRDSVQFWEM